MLITKNIIIPISKYSKYYLDKGVLNKEKNTIEIDISILRKNASTLIEAECDICNNKKKISFKNYNENIKKYNIFSCSKKCSLIKTKKTNLEKYGVEFVQQNKDIKEKVKQTNLEKYGVEHVSQNNDIKEKIKQTNIDKFGSHYSKTDEYKEKVKQTNLEKYGVEHISQTEFYNKSVKQTNLEKYGSEYYSKTEEYKQKVKQTNLNKYGVDNYRKTEECNDKIVKTNLNRYGVEYYSQTKECNDKIVKTNLNRYGVEHVLQNINILNKLKQTNLEKYGVDIYKKSEESRYSYIISNNNYYIKYIDNNRSLFKCDLNKDHEFEIHVDNFHSRNNQNIPLCTICYPINDNKSIKEKILLEYIQSIYNGEIISGYRDGIEIDIYLPEIKIGIEFNGLYWHSNKFKENYYHINKKEYFKGNDIDIKFIYEDDFDNNLDIIKSQINNWLGLSKTKIYARKTLIKKVSTEEYRDFLNQNHIQGFVASKLVYGLYYNNNLVSLMCFDKKEGRLNMSENEWNLNRFCNLLNHQIIGGASKLLNHFIRENNPSRIISYADKDWSNGNLYKVLGFKLVNESKPDYKYIVDNIRKSKQNFTKSKLQKLGHDISLTESQIMDNLGINKIYDCGKMKFELTI